MVAVVTSPLIVIIWGLFFPDYYQEKLEKLPKKYCYHNSEEVVLMIENYSYKDVYIKYYQDVEAGTDKYIHFPIRTMPVGPVTVLGYSEDSLLVEFIYYYDRPTKLRPRAFKGWVYAKTLHDEPPLPKEAIEE